MPQIYCECENSDHGHEKDGCRGSGARTLFRLPNQGDAICTYLCDDCAEVALESGEYAERG